MKLKALRPVLAPLPSRIGWLDQGQAAQDRQRKALNPGRAWYGTAAWQRRRWDCLVAALFTCARCGVNHGNETRLLVADHITPHRGDPDLFWHGALQCLCKGCHDGVKQSEEKGGVGQSPHRPRP